MLTSTSLPAGCAAGGNHQDRCAFYFNISACHHYSETCHPNPSRPSRNIEGNLPTRFMTAYRKKSNLRDTLVRAALLFLQPLQTLIYQRENCHKCNPKLLKQQAVGEDTQHWPGSGRGCSTCITKKLKKPIYLDTVPVVQNIIGLI